MAPSDDVDRDARIKRLQEINAFHVKHGMGEGETDWDIALRSLSNRFDYMEEVLEVMIDEVETFRRLVGILRKTRGTK